MFSLLVELVTRRSSKATYGPNHTHARIAKGYVERITLIKDQFLIDVVINPAAESIVLTLAWM